MNLSRWLKCQCRLHSLARARWRILASGFSIMLAGWLVGLSGCARSLPAPPSPTPNTGESPSLTIPHYAWSLPATARGFRAFRHSLALELNDAEQVILYRDKWRGADDLSGRIGLMYGRKNLYLAAEISDDDVVYAGHPGEWSGDALNLLLKTETEEGVREFLFKFSCQGTRYCYYDRLPHNGEEQAWGDSWAAARPGGYVLRAVIPFRNLGIVDPAATRIWLNVSLEDNGRSGYMILRGQTDGFLNAPAWIPAEFGAR
ncbi:hypothetical protein ACFL34_00975 [Candidatus Sumerlaeota bacterium]